MTEEDKASAPVGKRSETPSRKTIAENVAGTVLSYIVTGIIGILATVVFLKVWLPWYSPDTTTVEYTEVAVPLVSAEAIEPLEVYWNDGSNRARVSSLYQLTWTFTHSSGPQTSFEVMMEFPANTRFYTGPIAKGPDAAHRIQCDQSTPPAKLLKCEIRSIESGVGSYSLSIVSDTANAPTISESSSSITLSKAGTAATRSAWWAAFWWMTLGSLISAILFYFLGTRQLKSLQQRYQGLLGELKQEVAEFRKEQKHQHDHLMTLDVLVHTAKAVAETDRKASEALQRVERLEGTEE